MTGSQSRRRPRAATPAGLTLTAAALLTAALLAAALLAACVTEVVPDCHYGPSVVRVRYEVTSTAGNADIELFDAGGDLGSYRLAPTPWHLTERVHGDAYVRLRARNSRPLGTVSAAIYVDDVLWKRESGAGAVAVETYGIIEAGRGWNCGYGVFVQTWE